jgi:hypothetical protein
LRGISSIYRTGNWRMKWLQWNKDSSEVNVWTYTLNCQKMNLKNWQGNMAATSWNCRNKTWLMFSRIQPAKSIFNFNSGQMKQFKRILCLCTKKKLIKAIFGCKSQIVQTISDTDIYRNIQVLLTCFHLKQTRNTKQHNFYLHAPGLNTVSLFSTLTWKQLKALQASIQKTTQYVKTLVLLSNTIKYGWFPFDKKKWSN